MTHTGYRGWMALGIVAVATGCMPSREVRSAGQVGCSPGEISISDGEHHLGLIQSGESWVAECHGRTFHCTQINGEQDHDKLFNLASEQVSCQEEAESPQEQESREARREARARAAARPPSTAPTGAAGFDFGMSAEAAQQRCEAAGKTWSKLPSSSHCSGPATDLGIDAAVQLSFCDERACRVTVEQRPAGGWASHAVRLKNQLEAKYGAPQSNSGSVPEACRSEANFARCLEQGTLTLSYQWTWASGEGLELDVGKPDADHSPSIRLVYSRPKDTVNLSAL